MTPEELKKILEPLASKWFESLKNIQGGTKLEGLREHWGTESPFEFIHGFIAGSLMGYLFGVANGILNRQLNGTEQSMISDICNDYSWKSKDLAEKMKSV